MAGTCIIVCYYRNHDSGAHQYLVCGRSIGIGTVSNVRRTGLVAGDTVYCSIGGFIGMYQKVCSETSE